MRVEAAGTVLRLVYFAGILITTGVGALASYGYGSYAPHFVATVGIGTLVFSYAYAERGVYNQKNRDKADVGQNFAGPEMLMDNIQIGAAVFAAEHGRPPTPQEREAIEQAVGGTWSGHRDGVDIDATAAQEDRNDDGTELEAHQ